MFRVNIFDELDRLERQLRNNQSSVLVSANANPRQIARMPVSDIYETENSVIAVFELPGIEKEDVELSIHEGRIEVKVDKKIEEENNKAENSAYKIQRKRFYNSLPLPTDVVSEKAEATLKNGILRIEMPKAVKQEIRRKIEIK